MSFRWVRFSPMSVKKGRGTEVPLPPPVKLIYVCCRKAFRGLSSANSREAALYLMIVNVVLSRCEGNTYMSSFCVIGHFDRRELVQFEEGSLATTSATSSGVKGYSCEV